MNSATATSGITSVVADSECRQIPFQVICHHSTALMRVPMTHGLCIPRGSLVDAASWDVIGLGHDAVAAQVEVLNRWPDGSVRWLLMHFVAPEISPGCTECALVRRRVDHESRASERLPEVSTEPQLFDEHQRPLLIQPGTRQDTDGSVRNVSIRTFQVPERPFLELQLRIESWPAAGLMKVQTQLRNIRRALHKGGLWDLGDAGSFLFRGLHLEVSRPNLQPMTLIWQTETTQERQQSSAADTVQIVQFGSGSSAWNNTNHVAADGKSPVRLQGYEVRSAAGVSSGLRSEPMCRIVGKDGAIAVRVPEFWQQFPSSLSVHADRITVGLFPAAAEQTYELQGGEQKTQTIWICTSETSDDRDPLQFCEQPPRVVQSADWVADCRVLPWFPGSLDSRSDDPNVVRFQSFLNEATSGDHSIAARREKIDEYGWRNFGDVHADHEQTHYAGDNVIISHYNNQFDMICGGILNLIVSGDSKWFDLFDPLARHVMDVDIYHTQEDRTCFNGGLFWHTDHYVDAHTATHRTYSRHNAHSDNYGGGLSCEHNYTTGLLLYYFLTGSPAARESVLSLADWVIAMDDGSGTIFGLLDSGPTGLASATVFEDFHGPGRGAGNSINALVDAWTVTSDNRYLAKAEELIRRVMHPQQDCDALHLSDAEGHWSYTVCLTAVGRYLMAKRDAHQFDETYEYARQTLAHYGHWMAQNEQPALLQPEKLEYPTEAWAAQEFRKANALRIAACCCDNADEQLHMRRRADELNDAAWHDLYRFGQQHLTARCLSIVMTEGLRDLFHRTCLPDDLPAADITLPSTQWTMFVPQKIRIKHLFKQPARLALAAVNVFNPRRVIRTIDALKRHCR
ncbi:MAG: hypothetical protein R3C59_18130 [Planctomycetaceae bacterium]